MKALATLCSLSLIPLSEAVADSEWLNQIQIHGFASQALIFTTDNNFYGDSDHGSANFTEVGLNSSVQLTPKVRAAGQLLSRTAGNMDNGSPSVDYALFDFTLLNRQEGNLGLYLGRIKNPVGLYNESRDVAHTRQGVFSAQSIYFDTVRELAISSDGVQLHGEYFLPTGSLLVQFGIGYPIPDKNVEHSYMERDWAGKLDGDDLSWVGRVMYEHDGGRWIFSLSTASLELDFDSKPSDNNVPFIGINSGEINIDYTVISGQFNAENWQFTSEVAIQNVNYDNIGGLFSDAGTDPLAYTLELNYRLTSQWQTFIRYEVFYLNRHDRNGKKTYNQQMEILAPLSLPVKPSYAYFSKSWVVGGRWDISPNLMARAEYHWFNGAAILSSRDNNLANVKQNWDMFAASLSYRF